MAQKGNNRLRNAIFVANLRQYEVAEKVGISEAELSRIIYGRKLPDEGLREKFASALGVASDELFVK